MLKVTLFRSYTDMYFFELNENGMLKVYSGDSFSNPINKIVNGTSVLLSNEQINHLNSVLGDIKNFQSNDLNVWDAWKVIFEYKDKTCKFSYGAACDKNVDAVVTKLIEYSPIKIILSWS